MTTGASRPTGALLISGLDRRPFLSNDINSEESNNVYDSAPISIPPGLVILLQ